MSQIALFGDVQGHAQVYADALELLGVDLDTGVVPDGLIVVQVGDLIHKGPDSEGVVALADRLLRRSPDNYVQLTGNHEGQYLSGPVFWGPTIADEAALTIARWFVDGASRIAAGFDTEELGPVLVSHGGMSLQRWIAFDSIARPQDAAAALNEQFWNDPESALQPGIMLRGESGPPGVAWTEPSQELYRPWIGNGSMPFSQVHGHASPYSWSRDRWFPGATRQLRKGLQLDKQNRHTRLEVHGRTFIGIDTAFSESDVAPIIPLILTQA